MIYIRIHAEDRPNSIHILSGPGAIMTRPHFEIDAIQLVQPVGPAMESFFWGPLSGNSNTFCKSSGARKFLRSNIYGF